MSEQNRRLVLARRPSGLVDETTTRLETDQLPELADGEALVKVRYLSIDPTIRTWMDDIPSYLPPIQIDDLIRSGGVGEVIDSRSEAYKPGQLLFGMTGWQEYVIADTGERAMQVLPDGVPPALAIGIPSSRTRERGSPPCVMTRSRLCPSTNSIVRKRMPSSSSTEKSVTILGWLRPATVLASRSKRASRSAEDVTAPGSTFTATSRPRRVSRAR